MTPRGWDAISLMYHISVMGFCFLWMSFLCLGFWRYIWELALDIIGIVIILAIAWLHCLALLSPEARR